MNRSVAAGALRRCLIVAIIACGFGILCCGRLHAQITPPPAPTAADLNTPDLNRRQSVLQRLMNTPDGRRAIIRAASDATDPATAEWFRKWTYDRLLPESLEAINGGDAHLYEYAIFVVGMHFHDNVGFTPATVAAAQNAAAKIQQHYSAAADRAADAKALVQLGKYARSFVVSDVTNGPIGARTDMVRALNDSFRPLDAAFEAPLQKLVLDGDRATRPEAIVAISQTPGAARIYGELGKSSDLNIRLNAIDGFAMVLDREQLKTAMEPFFAPRSMDEPAAAGTALLEKSILVVQQSRPMNGGIAGAPAAPPVMQAPLPQLYAILDSADATDEGKRRALFAIGEQGANAANAVPRLTKIAGDSTAAPLVRAAAITALGRMGSAASAALATVQTAAADSHRPIHDAATVAMERINKNAGAPPFQEPPKISRRFTWKPTKTVVPDSVVEHMQFILQMVNQFKADRGAYPKSQGDLRDYFADDASERAVGINPRSGWAPGFWYVAPVRDVKDGTPAPIIYESHGGPLVAFTDGLVRECNSKANPPVVRNVQANLLDFRDAINTYLFKHQQKYPERIEQLREMFPDDASWQRVLTNPTTGESPGYAFAAPTAKPWESAKLQAHVMVYQLSHGARDSASPALCADLQLR